MKDRIKETFDAIHAEPELKTATTEFLAAKTKRHRPHTVFVYRRLVSVIACFILLLTGFGGYNAYFTQTSIISIDINPSIELNLNRFGNVLSVNGYNDDGLALASTLDVQFMNYTDAIHAILSNEQVVSYLAQDAALTISVAEQNEKRSVEILNNVEACIPANQTVNCYRCHPEATNTAHAAGLSVGKYRAFLELQKQYPDITTEDVKGLTMRQINDLLQNHPSSNDTTDDNRTHYGAGKQYHHGTEHGRNSNT